MRGGGGGSARRRFLLRGLRRGRAAATQGCQDLRYLPALLFSGPEFAQSRRRAEINPHEIQI